MQNNKAVANSFVANKKRAAQNGVREEAETFIREATKKSTIFCHMDDEFWEIANFRAQILKVIEAAPRAIYEAEPKERERNGCKLMGELQKFNIVNLQMQQIELLESITSKLHEIFPDVPLEYVEKVVNTIYREK
jgi:hypothetical protein